MKFRHFLIGLLALLGGCAIHPTPKDFSGVSTYDIVKHIRCETRQALLDSLQQYLAEGPLVDDENRNIANKYIVNPTLLPSIEIDQFKGRVRKNLDIFSKAGIAYYFSLDMTEINNIDGELDFLRTLTKGVFGFYLKGNFDRSRQNVRTFTITDSFADLIRSRIDCQSQLVGDNYIYPIAGRIGVDEMIHAFVSLTIFQNLSGNADHPGDAPKGPPTLVDALQFTTTLTASATPHVEFAPIGRTISVSHSQLTGTASRIDKHQVVVGLAIQEAVVPELKASRGELFGRLLTATGRGSQLAAASAIDQYLTRTIFSPSLYVTP